MNHQYPLVSIAVTTYNGARYLRQQLDSLLAQDYPSLEIVVADDCSTDNTRAILVEYECHENFRWYKNAKNLGYIKNFEHVIKRCRGEYIALCDQDDEWYTDKITKTLAFLHEKDALLAYCDADLIAADNSKIGMNLLSHSPTGPIDGGEYEKFYLLNTVNGCTALFRRELFDQAAPFPIDVPHDWWLSYIAAFDGRLAHTADRLMGYRMHANNTIGISYRIKKRNLKQYLRRKLSRYSKRFIYDKTVRPVKWGQECLEHFERFKAFEEGRGKTTTILNVLTDWMNAKMSNDARVEEYRSFFFEHHQRLGIKMRSLLFMTIRKELIRAKIKLCYTLASPLLFVILLLCVIWTVL
ncbi:glycosyltransferase family 2 protein [Marinagarivorans cellulosilyticus]|uniref:Rhamnosyltransferase n=1 Tax=Marinagarivorans cellulosilyticus TaxID=2721545 RepID=A0AAN2BK18_9GAMM|nr:glycosyltransferase family 2 protein [Marinagarivorans cellulosilyticus]BCD97534.1 rhamnosyltransferase [Marinagarivorans cellulosilyticus]